MKPSKIIIVLLLAFSVGVVVAMKNSKSNEQQKPAASLTAVEPAPAPQTKSENPTNSQKETAEVKAAGPSKAVQAEKQQPKQEKPAAPKALAVQKPVKPVKPAALPKLLELGADKCVPCKMMAPVLDELKKEYKGKLEVVFIDVWKAPSAGEKYNIESIPTQIFYDAEGNELFRHIGFYPKEDILAKFKELGVKP